MLEKVSIDGLYVEVEPGQKEEDRITKMHEKTIHAQALLEEAKSVMGSLKSGAVAARTEPGEQDWSGAKRSKNKTLPAGGPYPVWNTRYMYPNIFYSGVCLSNG